MSFSEELASWMWPKALRVEQPPQPGDSAPSTELLKLPTSDGKPAVIAFLRHCGCPFAEKSLRQLREASPRYPNIHFIAISHSSPEHTKKWLYDIGGSGTVEVIVDESRELYARWGLGTSDLYYLLSPWAIWSMITLGKQEGIWNKPTESGTRWQKSGFWTVDGSGTVRWGGPARTEECGIDLEGAMKSLDGDKEKVG